MTLPRCHVETGRARESAAWGRVLLTMLLLCLPDGPAHAGWTTFTTADGLAERSVHAILQDSLGVLWLGTNDGVSRYDGENWTTITPVDGHSDAVVYSIFQDSSGAFWFGTGYGVSRYDGRSLRTYTSADGLVDDRVMSIFQDDSGALWFGTPSGVSRHDGTRWTTYTTADGLCGNFVYSILQDNSGTLWFGTSDGVSRFDGIRWTIMGPSSGSVLSMLQDDQGAIWFGTYGGGVIRYTPGEWTTFTQANGLADNRVTSVFQDRSGVMWFGTWTGVTRYDRKNWTTFTTADGLADEIVQSIAQDVSGALWFGTLNGVSRFDGEWWTGYPVAVGRVNSILQDDVGTYWFGHDSGVSRFDGKQSWMTYAGLPDNRVSSVLQDRSGALWFGTQGGGVSRYEQGGNWTTFTDKDGLADNSVSCLLQDSAGALWVGTYYHGVSRYDGERWTTFTHKDGLANDAVSSIIQDRSGSLWFGGYDYASRYDGEDWTSFAIPDSVANTCVTSIIEDAAGALWFGTVGCHGGRGGGVVRYAGSQWTNFTTDDGLADNWVTSIVQDDSGALWFGTGNGISHFDGDRWSTLSVREGLIGNSVTSMIKDRYSALWIGTAESGICSYHPDRVAPRTIVLNPPRGVSPARDQSLFAVAAYNEIRGVQFSHRIDEGPWSEWSGRGEVNLDLAFPADGVYVVRVRSRDLMGNVESAPAVVQFEIDGTPPTPILTSPASGQAVRDTLSIAGTAIDARFQSYTLRYASADGALVGTLATSTAPATEELLARWNTATVPDGVYELRLSVTDTLRLTGTAVVPIVVDNAFPPADQTSPASVTATAGGDVYTTHREAHVYFPPNAFARDATVTIVPADSALVPEMLPGDIPRVLPAYRISWTGSDLCKPAVLEMAVPAVGSLGGSSPPEDPRDFAVYHAIDGSSWERLGGTLAAADARISATITMPGLYALYLEDTAPPGSRSLSTLTLSPRVLSPLGGSSGQGVAIGFRLGCASPVTVKVYNRAGRLIRRVLHGETLGPGSNLIRWDARDDDGGVIPDGIYLLTVESRGERLVKSIAVAK